ncbi:hypothetical protein DVH24_041238 [Malus domestica]|uniref:RNase H type-1 domain-containing protein n=1 Tax=Malus domestica TaxID=3750 RepID=A0A498IEY5_MALDO|nr:hypothetical protein DVH24_041238 [Malus domestica]
MGFVLRNDRGEFLAALSTKVTGILPAAGTNFGSKGSCCFCTAAAVPSSHVLLELEGDALLVINALSHKGVKDSSPFGHILDDTRRILENQAQWKHEAFWGLTGFGFYRNSEVKRVRARAFPGWVTH